MAQPIDLQVCHNNALFASALDSSKALGLWLTFMVIIHPVFTALSVKISLWSEYETGSADPRGSRPWSGIREKYFIVNTILLALNAFFIILEALCVQVRRFCDEFPIDKDVYIGEWVVLAVINGAMFGTAALAWYNCLRAVKRAPLTGQQGTWKPWWGSLAVFGMALTFPLIALALVLVILVQDEDAYKDWKPVKIFLAWKGKRRGPVNVLQDWYGRRRAGGQRSTGLDEHHLEKGDGASQVTSSTPPPRYAT